MARPLVEWEALTSSQLDAWGGPTRDWRSSCEPIEPSFGIGMGSGVSVARAAFVSLAGRVADEPTRDRPGAATSSPSLTKLTVPGSGQARPDFANGEAVS